ncbi:Exonuclease mut-7 [Porphyridium purpureum]|uniref:Exonuclease mut-7 n=1 Tax=Porphyridium purpureum TaxID=35688 RepID=A0A5J4YVF7_PORPP|nr:Exonuclease mut-7 [Porphyridium purpureum]|eukprot:POR9257..scf209_3
MRVRREGLADDPDFIFIGSLLKYVSVAPEHQRALKQNAVVALQKHLLECWSQGIFSVCASLLCYEGLTEYAESFSASRKAVLAELIADGQHILAQDFAKQWRIRSVNMQSGSALSMLASERVDEYMCVPADVVVLLLRCEESLSAAEQIVGDICQKKSSQPAWSLGVDAEWEPVRGSRETKIQPRPVILQMALGRSHVLIADFKELEAADLLERVDQLICSLLFSVSWIIGFGFLETDVRYLKSAWGEYNFPRAFESHSNKYLEAQLFLKNCKSFSSLVTTVFPGFMLDKREQCSRWESERPLRDTQISYAALDAYVLVLVYRELYELSRERMLRDLQLHCRDKAHLVSRESLTDSQRQRECKCVAFVLSKSCEMTSLDGESPLFIVVVTRPGFVCDMDALRQALDLSDEWSIRMASISECITEFGAVPGRISVCGFRRPDVRVFMDATLKHEVGREVIFSGSTPDDALLCTPGAWEGLGMWFTASVCKQVTPKERPLPSDEVAVGLWYESTEPDAYPMPTKHARRLDCTLKINEAARVFSGSQPAFVLDGTCIGLARRLRAVGIDAIYCESKNSAWIIEQATLSSRVLLSRDCDLIGQVHRGNATVVAWYIRSQSTMQQIREVLEVFDLKVAESQLLSRCVKCNASCFQEIPKTSVYGRVPARTYEIYDQFWTCGGCDQIFWRGLRFEHATRSLDSLVNDLE